MALKFLNDGYFAGKVGIGTESPVRKLHIQDTTGNPQLVIGDGASAYSSIQSANSLYINAGEGGGGSNTIFRRGTSLAESMRIDSSGNVGIGTASPTEPLTVSKTASGSTTQIASLVNPVGTANTGVRLWMSGTNTTTRGTFIDAVAESTSNDHSLRFGTSASSSTPTEKMRITSSGNVGIGTTSPDYQLEVENTSSQATIGITGGNTDARLHLKNNEGTWLIQNDYSNTGALSFYNSTHRVVITEGGNVGIGTTSPSQPLEVHSTIKIGESGVTGGRLISADSMIFQIDSDNTSGSSSYRFRTNGTADDGTELMRIQENGNVGIGTTSPDSKLSVTSTTLNSEDILYLKSGADNVNDYLGIAWELGVGGNGPHSAIRSFAGPSGSDARLGFLTTSDGGTTLTEGLSVAHNGNVGIGTTSPSHKLTIAGTTSHTSAKVSTTTANANFVVTTNNSNFALIGQGSSNRFDIWDSNAGATRLSVNSAGNVGIGTVSPTAGLHVVGTGLFTGLVSGITPVNAANFVTKAYVDGSGGGTGPFLPLAGGTMTGNVTLNDNVFVKFGNQPDFEIGHDASNSYITHSGVGNLIIQNTEDNADIIFKSDNGSGGVTEYFRLDGGSVTNQFLKTVKLYDAAQLWIGDGNDFQIYHTGSNTFLDNYTGDVYHRQYKDNGDVYFQNDRGDGNVANFFYLDGGLTDNVNTLGATVFPDKSKIFMGDSNDLQIYHDGSNSYIKESGTGDLIITGGNDILFNDPNGFVYINMNQSNSVELYYANVKKLETGIVSVGAATTAGGTLIDGWKTTTQANAINDTTIATTAYVNNLIGQIPAGLRFEGTWDASTGNPPSASPENGQFWIVSVAGSTSLSGITDWKVGDWAIYVVAGAGTDGWQKVDNSSVLDGSGTGQSVTKWDGSGTSNTLTDGPITFSTNDSTFTGNVALGDDKNLDFGAAPDFRIVHNSTTNVNHVSSKLDRQLSINANIIQLTNQANSSTYLKLESGAATFAGDVTLSSTAPILYLTNTTSTTGKNWRLSSAANGKMYIAEHGVIDAITLEHTTGNATFAGDINLGANHIGRDNDNYIGFETDNLIKFRAAGATQVKISDGIFSPQTDSDVDLGSNGTRFKELWVDSINGGSVVPGSYLPLAGGTMSGNIVMGNNDITGLNGITFQNGCILDDSIGAEYLKFKYNGAAAGGVQIFDNQDTIQGYLYADGGVTSNFGLLTGSGQWGVRTTENAATSLFYGGSEKLSTTSTGVTVTGNATFTGIVETNKILVAKGQNIAHTPSSIKISQENTTKSQIRFYGADTSTAGILEFVGSTSNGSASGARLTINANGSSTFAGNVTIDNGTSSTLIIEKNATGGGKIQFNDAGSQEAYISLDAAEDMTFYAAANNDQVFYAGGVLNETKTGSTSTFAGNIGIGAAPVGNPGTNILAVGTAGTTAGGIQLWAANNQSHYLQFGDANSGGEVYRGGIGYNHSSETLLFLQGSSTALSFTGSQAATFAGKATSASTVSTDAATTLVTKNYVDSSAGNPSHFRQGHKSHNLTNAFTTCLTVNLSNHTSCYVTVCCFGDWGSHSAAAYRGEFFLQNGDNSYNEPGIILRQDDNTSNSGDQIVCQILDPTSTASPKNFEIQIRTTATTGTTGFTGLLTFTVQGQFNSVT